MNGHNPVIRQLFTEESSESRCVALVERCAGKYMKMGGGSIAAELLNTGASKPRASTLARNAEVVALWQSGRYSVAEIGRKLKINEYQVSSILDRAGLRAMKRRKDFNA